MVSRTWIVLGILVGMLFVAGWDVDESSDTVKRFHSVLGPTTGPVIGRDLSDLHYGAKYISIAELHGPGLINDTRIMIKSRSIATPDNQDTLYIADGGVYEGRFRHGIDSLRIIQIDEDATVSFETSN